MNRKETCERDSAYIFGAALPDCLNSAKLLRHLLRREEAESVRSTILTIIGQLEDLDRVRYSATSPAWQVMKELLLQALHDDYSLVIKPAEESIGDLYFQLPEVEIALRSALTTDTSISVRAAAAYALRNVGISSDLFSMRS